jgi:tRNA pseudouridine55 synthase
MGRRDKNPHEGVLNIDKPSGMTSHDVVDEVRRMVRQRRVGHAGTLDPAATGLLLVCLGRATRLCEYLVADEKEYRGTIQLGVETDTYDQEGKTVCERDASGIDRAMIDKALEPFIGEIDQKPPAFSAIKREGVPAYKLARLGEEVDLPTRRVKISSIEVLGWRAPHVDILVRCGAGTYMRSLAHDLGEGLGVGGHLSSLVRTAIGGWRVEDAVTLEAVQRAVDGDGIASIARSFDDALPDVPKIELDEEDTKAILCGREITLDVKLNAPLISAHNAQGRLIAVLAPASKTRWRPTKVFPPAG